MALGAPYEVILNSTLWELQAFDKAHIISLKDRDSINHILGEYVYEAISASLSNVLSKKGKGKSFIDIREEPALSKLNARETSVIEDEQRAYEIYKMNRMIDKMNWDLQQIYNKKNGGV